MMRVKDPGKDALQRYLADVAQSLPLSADKERALASRIKRGDEAARNELVEANLRFVITMALKYQNRGVPLEDLVNVGNIGLITAAERFDGTRGFKFISYAYPQIEWSCCGASTAMQTASTGRPPAGQIQKRSPRNSISPWKW